MQAAGNDRGVVPMLPPPRSMFVSLTAWSLIVLGVLGVIAALFVGFAWLLLFSADQREALATLPLFELLPPSGQLLLRNIGWLALVLLLTSAAAIPLGVALQRRRAWARVASVWACVALAVLHIAAVPWQWFEIDRWFAELQAQMPWFARESIAAMYWSTQLSGAAFALAFGLVFAWTAWKLARPAIRAECTEMK